jgi:arylsulfatase
VLKEGRLTASGGGVLGFLAVLGWCLHDLAVFLLAGWPAEVLGLVPGWLVGLGVGAVLGALLAGARWRAYVVLLVAFAAAAFLVRHWESYSAAEMLLPRQVGLLALAWIVAVRLGSSAQGERRPAGTHAALTIGFLGASLLAHLQNARTGLSVWLPVASGVVLAAGFLGRAGLRLTLSALALVPCVLYVGRQALRSLELPRPDLTPPSATAASGARSLVLIVLDTVRADHLSFFGHARETTPRIDAFAREHARAYLNARSTCSETVPSHASLFAGLQPKPAQMLYNRGAEGYLGRVPLAERLRAAGYRTGAVLSNGMLTHVRGLDRGFERYDDQPGSYVGKYLALGQLWGSSLLLGHKPYRLGHRITDRALAWIDSLRPGEPFFLVLNYMDAHGPYIPAPPYDHAFEDRRPRDPLENDALRERDLFPLLYDRELRYLDKQVGRLFDGLVARGRFEDSVVILTSDHGEAFGEHGFWVHGWMLYDELIHVPLFVKSAGPARPARERPAHTEPTSGADVYTIAMQELGLEPPPSVPALTLAEWNYTRMKPEVLTKIPLAELQRDIVTWLEGTTKYIVTTKGAVEAYDLARDPGERSPLPLDEAALDAARARAKTWWKEYPRVRHAALELDADTRRRMDGLGYTEGAQE